MPRPVRPWFRVYSEMFNDRKLLRLTPAQRWGFVAALGAARESPVPGYLMVSESEPMTIEELARYADLRVSDMRAAVEKMVSLGMLEWKERSLVVSNWDSRQYESDNVTNRTRAFRERSGERSNDVPGNGPDTETDTEKKTSSSSGAKRAPRRRATRIESEWIPTEANRTALAGQFPHVDQRAEHAKFLDYWQAKGGKDATKLDWDATYRNWIRSAAERTATTARTFPGLVSAAEGAYTAPEPPRDMPDQLIATWNRACAAAHRAGQPVPDWHTLESKAS